MFYMVLSNSAQKLKKRYWAFTRSDRRSDRLSDGRTKRLHDTIVGPTSRTDQSDRPVGPTIGTCKRPLKLL